MKNIFPPIIVASRHVDDDLLELVNAAESAIDSQLEQGIPCSVSFSAGKDSSAAMNLVLSAAAKRKIAGKDCPLIIVSHGSTGIENPEIDRNAHNDLERIRKFCNQYKIEVEIIIAYPALSSSWAVRTIGQGKVPTYAGATNRDCTIDFKITPQQRALKKISKEAYDAYGVTPTLILGTRFSESSGRRQRMEERGESAESPWEGDNGWMFLSPVARFTEEDVWAYLLACRDGAFITYSDFKDTERVYLDAAGTSCLVESYLKTNDVKESRGCGARHGCVFCQAVGESDKSLQAMIDNSNGEYLYMQSLNLMQRWIARVRYDWNSRSWLPRSINSAGYIRIQPNMLGSGQIKRLFLWAVSADADEAEESERLGIEPRFRLINTKTLIAIDAEWSKNGFMDRPFEALRWYERIYKGKRFYAPEIESFPVTPQPEGKFVYAGLDWKEGFGDSTIYPVTEFLGVTGISSIAEMMSGDEPGSNIQTSEQYDVDEEGASMFLALEARRAIKRCSKQWEFNPDITEGFKTYLRYGFLTLAKGQKNKTLEILRRTHYRSLNGLSGSKPDIEGFLKVGISKSEMDAILQQQKIDHLAKIEESLSTNVTAVDGLVVPNSLSADERKLVNAGTKVIAKANNRIRSLTISLSETEDVKTLRSIRAKIRNANSSIDLQNVKIAGAQKYLDNVDRIEKLVTDWKVSRQGLSQIHQEKAGKMSAELNEAYRQLIMSEAYISYASSEGLNPSFDGQHFPQLLIESKKTIKRWARFSKDHPSLLSSMGRIAKSWYLQAASVAKGVGDAWSFGVGMYIAAPGISDDLLIQWEMDAQLFSDYEFQDDFFGESVSTLKPSKIEIHPMIPADISLPRRKEEQIALFD